jgi:hypothetical protein
MRKNVFLALFLIFGPCVELHAAYVDPNTPSLLAQVLAPVFIVISLLWNHIWRGLQKLLRRKNHPADEQDPPA